MPAVEAIIKYGALSELALLDEPNLLVQSLTITPSREKQEFKGANLAVRALRYVNPMLQFQFNAIIGTGDSAGVPQGFADQHPGTLVAGLENYSDEVYGFSAEDGIMVFEDPSRSLTLESEPEVDFSVFQYPFVDESSV